MQPTEIKVDRVCAFTDGVYAIVITLLVLELKPPHAPGLDDRALLADLGKQLHTFVAYGISFLVVGALWWWHHTTFRRVEHCDDRTLALNLAHVFFVTLLPFTAALVGRYPGDGIAILLFGIGLALSALSLAGLIGQLAARRAGAAATTA